MIFELFRAENVFLNNIKEGTTLCRLVELDLPPLSSTTTYIHFQSNTFNFKVMDPNHPIFVPPIYKPHASRVATYSFTFF